MDWCLLLTFIHTYIEKPFDCTTAILVTCTIFIASCKTHHRRCTEIHHHCDRRAHHLCYFLIFRSAATFRTTTFVIKKMKQWHKIFYFCTRKHPKSQTFIASNANAMIKQETTQSKAKKHLFWFPPFGMKKTFDFTAAAFLPKQNNLTQKGRHSHTKKIIPGHSVLVRLAFFLSPYHFYDVCSDLTLLYLKFLLSASTVPTSTPLNHFP